MVGLIDPGLGSRYISSENGILDRTVMLEEGVFMVFVVSYAWNYDSAMWPPIEAFIKTNNWRNNKVLRNID